MEPKVFIDPIVYRKIMHWVNKSTVEISGLGKVLVNEAGDIIVTSAILVEQENAAASTDLDPQSVAKAMFELRNEPGELKFWWHSHVNMEVFWSGTDTATMEVLGAHGWFVSTVFNKKAQSRTAIYQKVPYRMFKDEITLALYANIPESTVKEWDEQFEKNCKTKVWPVTPYKSWAERDAEEKEKKTSTPRPFSSVREGRLVSESVENLMDVPDKHFPTYVDDWEVWFNDGTTMKVRDFEDKYDVDFNDPETKAMVQHEGRYETEFPHPAS
jgi:hypothetical protein